DAYRNAFSAAMVTDAEGSEVIADLAARLNVLIDPHTAIGVGAVDKLRPEGPVVTLATAHPAKFSDAIAAATGDKPAVPDRLQAALNAPETFQSVPRDLETIKSIIAQSRQEF
ncbi:MAG: threonine synthase, partial [Acidimicrobiia bacterium]|nr:threonine synthase [Acidimicrobiia bacterium]